MDEADKKLEKIRKLESRLYGILEDKELEFD
jgi:hypothetical protein